MKKCLYHSQINITLGFTLVELLVTVSIVAILAGVAAPSFIDLLSSNNSRTAAERFLGALVYARSEASISADNIVVCAKGDDITCSVAVAGTPLPPHSWNSGWIIFRDSVDANGSIDVNEEILRVDDLSSLRVTANGQPVGGNVAHFLSYDRSGSLVGNGVAVSFVDPDDNEQENVTVAASGFASSTVTKR